MKKQKNKKQKKVVKVTREEAAFIAGIALYAIASELIEDMSMVDKHGKKK